MKEHSRAIVAAVLGWLGTALAVAGEPEPLTCFSTVYQPYVMENNGRISGIDVDVIREMGRRLGRTVVIKLEPWRRLEKALKAGKRDCVFSYFHTPEREEYALFMGIPMHVTQYTLFFDESRHGGVTGLEDFFGQKIGVNRGFNTTDAFNQARRTGKITVTDVTEDSQSLQMLSLGRVNAVLTNYDVGRYLVSTLKLPGIVALQPPLSTTPAYLVLRRSPTFKPLLEQFNWALFEILKDGTYDKIRNRYMNVVDE